MSVIMTLWTQGDADKLEEYAQQNGDKMRGIADRAKEHGLIAHRFYGTDGQIMVIDEWADAESFQKFFEQEQGEIQPIMESIGATSEPQIRFWRKLETNDEVGWNA